MIKKFFLIFYLIPTSCTQLCTEQTAEENSLSLWINVKRQILLSFKQHIKMTIILYVFWLIHTSIFYFA